MENISDFAFVSNYFPYPNFKKVSDLINYDGPILSHFQYNEKDILYLWVDNSDTHNRWLVFEVSRDSFVNYLYKEINLKTLITSNQQDFLLLTDINESLKHEFNNLISKDFLPKVYLPTEKSYFDYPIPNVYAIDTPKNLYSHALLSDSISVKVENKSEKFLSAIKVESVLNVLKNIKQSFTSYISINFKKDFSSEDFKGISFDSLVSTIVNDSELLIPNLKYSSFCASITTDYLMSKEFSPKIKKWRQETFFKFKQEVIEVDYDLDLATIISEKYNENDRKAIYNPIIDISKESNDYKVSITDKSFTKTKKTLTPITKIIREKLIPKIQPVESVKTETLFQIIGMGEKVDEKLKINKSNILETKELDYAELTQTTNTISFKENELYLKEQLEFKVVYNRSIFIIDYPPLNIYKENSSFDSVKNDFYKDIFDLYIRLINIDDSQLSVVDLKTKTTLMDMVSITNLTQ